MPRVAAQSKGTLFIPAVKALRARKDDARAVVPPELHEYLAGRILPASWYPEDDLLHLLRALARIISRESTETWEMFGEQAAEAHCTGPYEGFVRYGPRRLLEAYDALWRLQHSTGRWQIAIAEEDAADAQILDFPVGMPEYGNLMVGYFRRMLTRSGARWAACTLLEADAESGRWRLQWRP
jgi:hypothetical protein